MAATSVAHEASDPLRNFKFRVAFHHPSFPSLFANAGFMSVSGLNITTEVIPYREGGMNTTTQKMPGQTDFSPLTLSRGLIVGHPGMMAWMGQLFDVIQGTGKGGDFRATVTIKVLEHPSANTTNPPVKAAFKVYNAWPTSVAFTDLDAGANAIIVQQMTLAHEGFDFALAGKGKGSTAKF